MCKNLYNGFKYLYILFTIGTIEKENTNICDITKQ